MSTITICDVCSDKIDDQLGVPKVTLPVSWWVAMGLEPVNDPIDVCSPGCMAAIAKAADEAGDGEQEEDQQEEDEEVPAVRAQFVQAPLRAPSSEEINRALGVTERG